MTHRASLPFVIKRSSDVFGAEMRSTVETIHGLVLLDGDRIVVQWRALRETDRFGKEIASEREVDAPREVVLPLSAFAGVQMRRRWWGRADCILLAADLGAFDAIAGAGALALDHPAQFAVPVKRAGRMIAEEFAAEVSLALAERLSTEEVGRLHEERVARPLKAIEPER